MAKLHAHPLDVGRADRAPRPRQLRPHHLPAALRRPAAAAGARHGRRRPPRAGLPRRADRRPRPAGPPRHLGPRPRAARRRRHRRPHHALHGRGRAARRRRRDHRRAAGSSPRAPPRSCAAAAPRTPCASPAAPASTWARCSRRCPTDCTAAELTPGAYRITGKVDPQLLATVTSWCAQHGVMPDRHLGRAAHPGGRLPGTDRQGAARMTATGHLHPAARAPRRCPA